MAVAYEFYTDTYKGASISRDEWAQLEARVADQLKRYKRAYTVTAPEESSEAMAVCAMADALAYFIAAQNIGGAVTAASIGSVSVTYGGSAGVDLSARGQERELYRCAARYLEIYRGVGKC